MNLIITRPATDGAALRRKIEALGHRVVLAPLLAIEAREGVGLAEKHYQAVCITSANGLINDEINHRLLSTPIYCIGTQSAAAARVKGFTDIRQRGGNLPGLLAALVQELKSHHKPVLYLAGSETTGDMKGQLERAGFAIDKVVVYDAVAQPLTLAPKSLENADGVLLYSPRSARLWTSEVEKLAPAEAARLMYFCLSKNVADNLPQHWPKTIAKWPDEDNMLSMLDQAGEAE